MERIFQKLRSNGLRVTDQRRAVVSFLEGSGKSVSIKEIHRNLVKSGVKIDEVSVYRIIEAFKDLDLIHINSEGRVNLCSHLSCAHSFHYSTECSDCKLIMEPDLNLENEKALAKIFGLSLKNIKHVQVSIKCKDCR